MAEEEQADSGAMMPVQSVGARLRAARETAGLSLADIAQRTRISARFLDAIEQGNYADLPGLTYCMGFARAYARAVDLDEAALVADLREELDGNDAVRGDSYMPDEPADPARIPPRKLAWIALALLLMLSVGYGIFRMQHNAPPVGQIAASPAPAPATSAAPVAAAPQRPSASSPVVLTATGEVWLRIYDEEGTRILEKAMVAGETFTVPANARNPMILTGRPNMLKVTVGGMDVPPLGPPERTVADLPISASALLSRPPVPAPPAPASASPAQPAPNAVVTPTTNAPSGSAPTPVQAP